MVHLYSRFSIIVVLLWEVSTLHFVNLGMFDVRITERLLRANLLQPPNDIEMINSRLDVVEKFLESDLMLRNLINALNQFPDVDTINNSLGKKHLFDLGGFSTRTQHVYQNLSPKKPFNMILHVWYFLNGFLYFLTSKNS